jgi:HK97 family phage prohead protease
MADRNTNIVRSVEFRAAAGGDGLDLTGYAAVFDVPTVIDSWEGRFTETIARGAFKKTLQERGDRVVLQFDHGQHPLIGSMPIGAIHELREDDHGLFVQARLFDNDLTRPVRDAIDGGAIQGMSFRFNVVNDDWPENDQRVIRAVKLHEIGPVVFPAYEATTVGVRARGLANELRNDTDFRQQLLQALLLDSTSDDAADGTSDEAAPEQAPPTARLIRRDLSATLRRIHNTLNGRAA